ncbi:MAG: hypothetical protein RL701_5733 [Pseudomonadota bacterium]
MKRLARGGSCAYIIGLLIACGDDTAGSSGVAAQDPACSAPEPCEITERACVDGILKLTACERGEDAPPLPEMRSITQAEFRAELLEEARDQESAPRHWDAALQSLHLLPMGMSSMAADIDVTATGVAAYFDGETKHITIITDARTDESADSDTSQVNAMYVVSHELTHYLQDREFPLDDLLEEHGQGLDGSMSVRALVEGEAVVNSTRVLARLSAVPSSNIRWSSVFASLDDSVLASVRASVTPFHTAVLILPYSIGTRYVAGVWTGYDHARVTSLFSDHPTSLLDWFGGYGAGRLKPTLVEPLACAPPLAPAGFKLVELDSFGVTGVIGLLAAAGEPDLTTPRDLRADAIAVYVRTGAEPGPDSTLVVWRLRFSTEKAANAFAQRLPWDDVGRRVIGKELVLSAGPDVSRSALPDAVNTCPKLTELKPQDSGVPIAAARFLPPEPQLRLSLTE